MVCVYSRRRLCAEPAFVSAPEQRNVTIYSLGLLISHINVLSFDEVTALVRCFNLFDFFQPYPVALSYSFVSTEVELLGRVVKPKLN